MEGGGDAGTASRAAGSGVDAVSALLASLPGSPVRAPGHGAPPIVSPDAVGMDAGARSRVADLLFSDLFAAREQRAQAWASTAHASPPRHEGRHHHAPLSGAGGVRLPTTTPGVSEMHVSTPSASQPTTAERTAREQYTPLTPGRYSPRLGGPTPLHSSPRSAASMSPPRPPSRTRQQQHHRPGADDNDPTVSPGVTRSRAYAHALSSSSTSSASLTPPRAHHSAPAPGRADRSLSSTSRSHGSSGTDAVLSEAWSDREAYFRKMKSGIGAEFARIARQHKISAGAGSAAAAADVDVEAGGRECRCCNRCDCGCVPRSTGPLHRYGRTEIDLDAGMDRVRDRRSFVRGAMSADSLDDAGWADALTFEADDNAVTAFALRLDQRYVNPLKDQGEEFAAGVRARSRELSMNATAGVGAGTAAATGAGVSPGRFYTSGTAGGHGGGDATRFVGGGGGGGGGGDDSGARANASGVGAGGRPLHDWGGASRGVDAWGARAASSAGVAAPRPMPPRPPPTYGARDTEPDDGDAVPSPWIAPRPSTRPSAPSTLRRRGPADPGFGGAGVSGGTFYKLVAVVGGNFVSIFDGSTQYALDVPTDAPGIATRTRELGTRLKLREQTGILRGTTRTGDGSGVGVTPQRGHGLYVYRTAARALQAKFPARSRLLTAPRALMRVEVESQRLWKAPMGGPAAYLCSRLIPREAVLVFRRDTGYHPSVSEIVSQTAGRFR